MPVSCPHCQSLVEMEQAFSGDSGVVRCPSCDGVVRQEGRQEEDDVPRRLAHYEVLETLGRGGMGHVHLARDTRLGRDVALKFLPREYAEDEQCLERFQREARMASALNHPQICTIYDIGEDRGRPYIAMELIEGQTLQALGKQPVSLSLDQLVRVGSQVAQALAAAHAAGIVHRDIKPENVMVRADGYVKVLDFGLARPVLTGAQDHQLTTPGALVGTVRYMSPEQARGEVVGGPSDIFSLGVVFYELATGRHPFEADSHLAVLRSIVSDVPLPPEKLNPEIPATLAALVRQMVEKDTRLRPGAAEVASVLAELSAAKATGAAGTPVAVARRHTVGRQKELAELQAGFEVVAGQGLFLCVTGEPGIGKTTLIEDFLQELAAAGRPHLVGRGRCSERLAGTEAYLPFLEALESLLHGAAGESVARTMKALAPNWYVQVAPLAAEDTSLARTLADVKAASQERLKRELGAFLQEVSRVRPLVLFLDDVHWADPSTVDLLAYVGGKCEELRALMVLSYRPTDLALGKHPFGPLKLDLQARGVCRELGLAFLTRADIERYLALEFPEHAFPPELATLVHDRTEGSPLFMADLLRYLRDRGVLTQKDGRWTLGQSIPGLERDLPESVRSMIQQKIDQLEDDDRALLVAASVQGQEFDSAVVTEALGLDAADVEERLEVLDRVHAFVSLVGEEELPDRTLALRYRFVHVLYQNALYVSLRPTRRAKLSGAVAESLLAHHGEKSAHVAAELALLYEAARDFDRAAEQCLIAARNAVRVFAPQEAVVLARRGLKLLEALPDTPGRARKELTLLLTLGPPLKDTSGWTEPELQKIYSRASDLCRQIGQIPDLFPAMWGVWIAHSSLSGLRTTLAHGEELLEVAKAARDSGFLVQAHHALTTTHAIVGNWKAARDHAKQAMALYDLEQHREHKFLYGGHDPGSCCLAFDAQSLWMLGYPDQALERGQQALSLARELSHPPSLSLIGHSLAALHQLRRDLSDTLEQAEASHRLVEEQGLPFFPSVLLGWALAYQGQVEEGLARMRDATGDLTKAPRWWRAYFHVLMADVCHKAGEPEEGLLALAEAREAEDMGMGYCLPEIHRLEGELLLASGPDRRTEAEACFQEARSIARRQEAKSLELRAVMSLVRLYRDQGKQEEARSMLGEIYGWFTEGFDTLDLQEAKALLETM